MGMGQLLTLAADPYPRFSYKIILLIGTVLVKHNRVHGLDKADSLASWNKCDRLAIYGS